MLHRTPAGEVDPHLSSWAIYINGMNAQGANMRYSLFIIAVLPSFEVKIIAEQKFYYIKDLEFKVDIRAK